MVTSSMPVVDGCERRFRLAVIRTVAPTAIDVNGVAVRVEVAAIVPVMAAVEVGMMVSAEMADGVFAEVAVPVVVRVIVGVDVGSGVTVTAEYARFKLAAQPTLVP